MALKILDLVGKIKNKMENPEAHIRVHAFCDRCCHLALASVSFFLRKKE
jgi:hypothetical protein